MKKLHPEGFITDFENYFKESILIADFSSDDQLIAIAKPFLDFTEVMMHLTEGIFELVDFTQSLQIRLYEFGRNEFVQLYINYA